MANDKKPELRVTVFSDYICPFCYIGDARLNRLRRKYDLKVNWCFIEIHPETPAEGMPVTDLDYTQEHFDELMQGFYDMAKEEGLDVLKHSYTANSHFALLLAEAAKGEGVDIFYEFHKRIFEAYFAEGQNIGDQEVLRELANASGVKESVIDSAWSEPIYAQRLEQNLAAARELKVTGTPTFFFTDQPISGAVPSVRLIAAAQEGYAAQTARQH